MWLGIAIAAVLSLDGFRAEQAESTCSDAHPNSAPEDFVDLGAEINPDKFAVGADGEIELASQEDSSHLVLKQPRAERARLSPVDDDDDFFLDYDGF